MNNSLPYTVWNEIEADAARLKKLGLKKLFAQNPHRAQQHSITAAGLHLDYSKNFFDTQTQTLFSQLMSQADVIGKAKQMVNGATINNTEHRAALHTLLRAKRSENSNLEREFQDITTTLKRVAVISEDIHCGRWSGSTGKAIRHIVHIGIGGSFLGPQMVDEALEADRSHTHDISCDYIASVDAHHIESVLRKLDPSETIVIIVSKTFTTLESMANANTAKDWLKSASLDLGKHLIGVSANTDAAVTFGIEKDNVLPMWDWVGGRYSLWSAVGLPIAIRYGYSSFEALLDGAYQMDQHFLNAKPQDNMPMILGFLGLLYQHCFDASSHAVLTYDHRLRFLPDHLQQVDMESNGKSVSMNGEPLDHQSGPVIWGGEGPNGQHAFHQLLHQGTRFTSLDFIMTLSPQHGQQDHHDKLIASCLSQSQALMIGRSLEELTSKEGSDDVSGASHALRLKHKVMPGNRPSNTIAIDKLSAQTVGSLIALYEHKVFVQAMVWQINPFDQWGVELGKELGEIILEAIKGEAIDLDGSTQNLLELYKAARNKERK